MEAILLNSFYEVCITYSNAKARPRHHTHNRKLQTNIPYEHMCNIFIQVFPNQTQQHIKKIIQHDQVGYI